MRLKQIAILFTVILTAFFCTQSTAPSFKIARLKYRGGGDWYVDRTSLPNLIAFCNRNLHTNIAPEEDVVEVGSKSIFGYPFVYLTGHGNIVFSPSEAKNLRNYLKGGGFLHIDDNYGLDKFIRPEMKKVFPDKEFVELPFDHAIYHQKYNFNNGPPKIHKHDGKPAQGFGIFHEGRLVVYYTYESDLGDGWENPEIHDNPASKRQKALQMGANIMSYALTSP